MARRRRNCRARRKTATGHRVRREIAHVGENGGTIVRLFKDAAKRWKAAPVTVPDTPLYPVDPLPRCKPLTPFATAATGPP